MNELPPIETRLVAATKELIAIGVPPSEAAATAAKALTSGPAPKPWYSVDEVVQILSLPRKSVLLALRVGASEFKGAEKFCGNWRIPAAVVTPQLKAA